MSTSAQFFEEILAVKEIQQRSGFTFGFPTQGTLEAGISGVCFCQGGLSGSSGLMESGFTIFGSERGGGRQIVFDYRSHWGGMHPSHAAKEFPC